MTVCTRRDARAVPTPATAVPLTFLLLLLLSASAGAAPLVGLPNPAAAYCEALGYTFEISNGPDGQSGVCVLPDGRRVGAWEFYRGKVAPEYSYCARQGMEVRTRRTEEGGFVTECAVCVSDGREVGTVAELVGLQFGTVRALERTGSGARASGGAAGRPTDVTPGEPAEVSADEPAIEAPERRGGRHNPKRVAVPFGGRPPSHEPPSRFDWRALDGTTAVKAQGSCGSCWAFSTVGALECGILIKDDVEVDLSEQWLVSCNSDGWGCGGGGFAHAYHMLKQDTCGASGAVLESDFPYQATDVPCGCPYPHGYVVDGWGYLDPSVDIPDRDLIKRAIMTYGPVSVGVMADAAFADYNGGVFTGGIAHDINHAVVLVGWDDDQGPEGVWFLRNSWGMMWGENGYMRIAYGRNAVGWLANWVDYRDPIRIVLPDGVPGVIEPGEPVDVTVRIDTDTDSYVHGTAVMHYRFGDGDFSVSPLTPLGGSLFRATLPPASCGDAPEFFFGASGRRFGAVYNPRSAASDVYSSAVGVRELVFADDFEADLGWTVTNGPELMGGAWERGVPVGGGDRSDPPTDYDGSGSCYVTGNQDGDSDVDKDWTRLTSPVIDLSGGGDAVVEFAFWYRNDHGDNANGDYFITSFSDDGGLTWVPADTVGPRAPLPVGWHRRTITVADKVEMTEDFRVRFEAADLPGGSLVEAGLDDFSVSLLECDTVVAESEGLQGRPHLGLAASTPNPSSRETTIRYELPRQAAVTLRVFDAAGRVVRTLVDAEHRGAGPHAVRWDGRDDSDRPAPSGAYFYRLEAEGAVLSRKMILLR